jgi:hypothetical protein
MGRGQGGAASLGTLALESECRYSVLKQGLPGSLPTQGGWASLFLHELLCVSVLH